MDLYNLYTDILTEKYKNDPACNIDLQKKPAIRLNVTNYWQI